MGGAADNPLRAISRECSNARGLQLMAYFFVLGITNNAPYVICLALAVDIAAGGVGAVYLCAIAPAIAVKATVPLWFPATPPAARIAAAAGLASLAFILIGRVGAPGAQLAGAGLVSLQGGLGEAAGLALAGAAPTPGAALAAWASGTGAAGVLGYLWVLVVHRALGLSLRATLFAANALPLAWCAAFFLGIRRLAAGGAARIETHAQAAAAVAEAGEGRGGGGGGGGGTEVAAAPQDEAAPLIARQPAAAGGGGGSSPGALSIEAGDGARRRLQEAGPPPNDAVQNMSLAARARHVASLAPYTGPLVLVYFAEYSMQAGCWPAIGFPSPATKDARARFYLAANTAYQCAVFASRTFGGLLPIKHRGLWAMPIAQTALLAFFAADAALRFAYFKPLLLALAFAAGLLGGATYVCAFSLLAAEAPPSLREFSLAAASVADSLGIAAADVASVLLQGCLMRANGLADEAFWRCGAPSSS